MTHAAKRPTPSSPTRSRRSRVIHGRRTGRPGRSASPLAPLVGMICWSVSDNLASLAPDSGGTATLVPAETFKVGRRLAERQESFGPYPQAATLTDALNRQRI